MQYSSSEAVNLRQPALATRTLSEDFSATSRHRILRCAASLVPSGSEIALMLHTSHITQSGVCVLHDVPLQTGQEGALVLSVLVDGKARKLRATCRVNSSVCAGAVFRIGLTFTNLQDDDSALLARLLKA